MSAHKTEGFYVIMVELCSVLIRIIPVRFFVTLNRRKEEEAKNSNLIQKTKYSNALWMKAE